MKAQAQQALEFFLDWVGYDLGYSEHHQASLADEKRERSEVEARMSGEIDELREQIASLTEQLEQVRVLALQQRVATAEAQQVATALPDSDPTVSAESKPEIVSTYAPIVDEPADPILSSVVPIEPSAGVAAVESAYRDADPDIAEIADDNRRSVTVEVEQEPAAAAAAPPSRSARSANDAGEPHQSDAHTGTVAPRPSEVAASGRADQDHPPLSAFPPETPRAGAGSPDSAPSSLYRSAASFMRRRSTRRPARPSLGDLELPRVTSLVNRLVGRESATDQNPEVPAAASQPSVARERLHRFLQQDADDPGAAHDVSNRSSEE